MHYFNKVLISILVVKAVVCYGKELGFW